MPRQRSRDARKERSGYDRRSRSRSLHRRHRSHSSDYRYRHQHRLQNHRQRTHHPAPQHSYKSHKHRHSPSSSSSSYTSSPSSSDSNSSSVSSTTRRRRNTPHYKFQVGQKLGHKYRVVRMLGTGTFGRVLECSYKDRLYAIKVIKPVQKYIDSARVQRGIVRDLNDKDPNDLYHVVRYHQSFYHYQHFCLVFEPLGLSVYELIKSNKYAGFPLKLVQSFARQLFEAIGFMHRHGYTHTDLKPQNLLLFDSRLVHHPHPKTSRYMLPVRDRVKIIDFGGATHRTQKHSSIINTRQYRSPQWNEVSDVWSIGCMIPEMLTGDLLFNTHDDMQHLMMIKKCCGNLPQWMGRNCRNQLKKCFREGILDEDYMERKVKGWEDIVGMRLLTQICQQNLQLFDLLEKCLTIDHRKRISCEQALQHPFFKLQIDLQ